MLKLLGDVCLVKRGTTITQKEATQGNIPVVAGGLKPTYFHNVSNREGNVITISGSGANAGFVNFWDEPIFASDCSTVEVKRHDLSVHFVYYFLLSQQDFIYKELRSGAAQPHVYGKDIAKLLIPFPPLATQQKIVAKLDAIFAEIDKAVLATEANVKNVEALWQSTIDRVINDFRHLTTASSFSESVLIKSKLIDPKEEKFHNFIHIGAANIISNSDELCDLKTAKEEGLISGKFLFDENTVLYSKIRPYLKKVAKPSFVGLCSADVYPLVCNENLMVKDFLFYVLLSSDFTKFAISGSDRAGMPKVSREHLFSYKLNLPTKSSQEKLTSQINKIREEVKKSTVILAKKIEELNSLKESLLRQAFNGELVKD